MKTQLRQPNHIASGIVHWVATHPNTGSDAHSYALLDSGILLDPILPEDGGIEALAEFEPQQIVLTGRHHTRDSKSIADHFGIKVRVSQPGAEDASRKVEVVPFQWGETLAKGVTAFEIGAICPDESAIYSQGSSTALACADGLIRRGNELGFMPDSLLGDEPEAVKRDLRHVYREMLDLDFDHLLLAHGDPIVDHGHDELAAFVSVSDSILA
jgi:hypothetical protein